ncbi:MAG: Arc family DNA-binding protein [Pseudolabrys sp.]
MVRKADVVGLRLRMPAGLHRLLAASAKSNNRSLNSEILWSLAQYLGGDAPKFVEHMAVEQRRQLHNVLRKLISDPERAERSIASFEKEMEKKK